MKHRRWKDRLMQNTKTLLFTVPVLLVFLAALQAACGNTDDSGNSEKYSAVYPGFGHKEDKSAITIWAWDENYNIAAMEEAVQMYQTWYPDVLFQTVCMTQEEIAARLNSAMITGSRKSLPDIVLIEDYRIQHYLQNYESEFLALNDIISQSDFVSCKTRVNHVGDMVYGVPFDCGTVGLFYRLDMIEAAGFNERDMQDMTWEQYLAVGKKVKEKTGKAMIAMNPSDLSLIHIMMQSAGAWFTDPQGNLTLEENQALEQAMIIYQDMLKAGIVKTVSDWDQFIRAFQDGTVATVLTGSWISASITQTESQKGLWRVAAVPRMQGCPDSVNASLVGGSGWYVLKYAGNAQEASRFLAATFASNTKLLNLLVEKIHLVSALKAAYDCENYKKGQVFYGNQKIYEDMLRWTCMIPPVNYGTGMYAMEEIMAEALQQVLGGREVTEVLADYQEKYE